LSDPIRLSVERTAHVLTQGPRDGTARTVWLGLHGYGQRAADLLEDLSGLAGSETLLVAPEALSRFYRRGTGGAVGATWMTSAERTDEIRDYLAYLEHVQSTVDAQIAADARWHVLGFSQGAATASRWVAHTATPIERLLLWGGGLAHDLNLAAWATTPPVASVELVLGTADRYLTDDRITSEEARLHKAGVPFTLHRYEGVHVIPPDVLQRIAAQPPST